MSDDCGIPSNGKRDFTFNCAQVKHWKMIKYCNSILAIIQVYWKKYPPRMWVASLHSVEKFASIKPTNLPSDITKFSLTEKFHEKKNYNNICQNAHLITFHFIEGDEGREVVMMCHYSINFFECDIIDARLRLHKVPLKSIIINIWIYITDEKNTFTCIFAMFCLKEAQEPCW